MKLGKRQQAWVASLRAHPERKTENFMARREKGKKEYQACCLGEAVLVICRLKKKKQPFVEMAHSFQEKLIDQYSEEEHSASYPKSFYKEMGLKAHDGAFKNETGQLVELEIPGKGRYTSLADANDNPQVSWDDIADLITRHPDYIFERSI